MAAQPCPTASLCSPPGEHGLIVFKRGDTWRFWFDVCDCEDKPYDLTGCSAWMQLRDSKRGCALDSRTAHVIITGNVIEIVFNPAQTSMIKPGMYRLDLQLTYANGDVGSTETHFVRVLEDMTYDG